MPSRPWPDTDVDRLKALHRDGLSCAQMGRHLGKTRNAIIGKLHRLGLSADRPKHVVRSRVHGSRAMRNMGKAVYGLDADGSRKSKQAEMALRAGLSPLEAARTCSLAVNNVYGIRAGLVARGDLPPKQPPAEPSVARVSFGGLEPAKHCRFIPGDPKTTKVGEPLYCGLTPIPGQAYCPNHHQRCTDAPRTFASNRAYLIRDEQHVAHTAPKVFA